MGAIFVEKCDSTPPHFTKISVVGACDQVMKSGADCTIHRISDCAVVIGMRALKSSKMSVKRSLPHPGNLT